MNARHKLADDLAVALEPGKVLPDAVRERLSDAFRRIADGEDAQSALGLWLPDKREVIAERDRRLRAMMSTSNLLNSAKARVLRKRLTDYRAGPWQYERSMIALPERHREMWELMWLTEFIPSESRLRRILAAGSRHGQKTAL